MKLWLKRQSRSPTYGKAKKKTQMAARQRSNGIVINAIPLTLTQGLGIKVARDAAVQYDLLLIEVGHNTNPKWFQDP
jgi:hypothetical protein